MRPPPRPLRRVLLPVDVALLVVLVGVFGAATVLGALLTPFGRRRRPLRIAAFALAYCAMELVVLARLGGLWWVRVARRPFRAMSAEQWQAGNERLLASALSLVLRAGRRCFGFEVVVDHPAGARLAGGPLAADPLSGGAPVLVLARHGGPGDSFALVHLLLTRYHRQARVVLKDVLQFDPALDLLLNRLRSCFLPSPSGTGEDLTDRLRKVVAGLGPQGALLLFPEGGNWTPTRHRRAIRRLRRDHHDEAARSAALMDNVLPPRPGGVLACLDARPDLRVVIVAHAGLDRIVTLRQAWDQLPLRTPMTVRLWPAVRPPEDPDDRLAWLTTEWAVVDEWIDAHRAGQTGKVAGDS